MQPFHDVTTLPIPLVAISGCLAGDNVRYDGDHKAQPLLLRTLTPCVRWLPICPEIAAGMGVPRPPVQLRAQGGDIAVIEVGSPDRNHTVALQHGVASVIQQLHAQPLAAIILKARSPSCGIGSTPLFKAADESIALTDGLFARACREHFGDIPLLDEAALAITTACQAFALLLLIRADLAHVAATQREKLNAHYRDFKIDTTAPHQLQQQLAEWSERKISHAFTKIWSD